MENKKDYYKILGITEDEKKLKGDEFNKILKRNFRKLSLKYHPDKNPGDKDAEEKFKDVAEAYDTLLNKRDEYDNPMSGFSFSGPSDIDEILRQFRHSFGFGFGDGMDTQEVGDDVSGTVTFTLEEALNGTTKKVRYRRHVRCNKCNGTGIGKNGKKVKCSHCGGHGRIVQSNGWMTMEQTCPYCGGSGEEIKNPCKSCNGTGLREVVEEESFKLGKGIAEGMAFVKRGKGNEVASADGKSGDLYIVLKEIHGRFERRGDDVLTTIDVNVFDAITGCKMSVKGLDGKYFDVEIPKCSEEDSIVTCKGKGLPRYSDTYVGNLICRIHIKMPKSLSDSQIKAIKEIK